MASFGGKIYNVAEKRHIFPNETALYTACLIGVDNMVKYPKQSASYSPCTYLIIDIQKTDRSPDLMLETVALLKDQGNQGGTL